MMKNRKSAIVTGADQGIGLEIAKHLLSKQYNVIAVSGPGEDIEELQHLNPFSILSLDFREPNFILDIESLIDRENLKIDLLINNAGIYTRSPFEKVEMSLLVETFQVNCFAPFLLCQLFDRHRRKDAKSYIINIASDAALVGARNGVHYASSKGALISMTKSVAKHYKGQGVTVNAIIPGVTRTKQSARGIDYYDKISRNTLLLRIAEPSDIVSSVEAIISGNLDYMTGSALNLTGGRHL